MPRTAEDVAIHLHSLGRVHERAEPVSAPGQTPNPGGAAPGEGTYLLRGPDGTIIALQVIPPIVAINAEIGPLPKDEKHQLAFYRRLLELSATDLMYAAYGIEGDRVVLSAALPLDNLDANELDATLSDIDVALVRHTKELSHFARD